MCRKLTSSIVWFTGHCPIEPCLQGFRHSTCNTVPPFSGSPHEGFRFCWPSKKHSICRNSLCQIWLLYLNFVCIRGSLKIATLSQRFCPLSAKKKLPLPWWIIIPNSVSSASNNVRLHRGSMDMLGVRWKIEVQEFDCLTIMMYTVKQKK